MQRKLLPFCALVVLTLTYAVPGVSAVETADTDLTENSVILMRDASLSEWVVVASPSGWDCGSLLAVSWEFVDVECNPRIEFEARSCSAVQVEIEAYGSNGWVGAEASCKGISAYCSVSVPPSPTGCSDYVSGSGSAPYRCRIWWYGSIGWTVTCTWWY